MATTSRVIFLLVALVFIPAETTARTNFYRVYENPNSIAPSSPGSKDDICKSLVESQGYICEQHQVKLLIHFSQINMLTLGTREDTTH